MILGIDLSGPANAADTALVWFVPKHDGLEFVGSAIGASDADIVRIVRSLQHPVVGLDAPLSYNDGGGDRPGDAALRSTIVAAGMKSGSVMTPTFTRMAYLTLRGMAVARALETEGVSRRCLLEVHPGAVFALHGAPLDAVLDYKTVPASRKRLLRWLSKVGVRGVPSHVGSTCHATAACGAALGAWHWTKGTQKWLWKASPPHHPYDFAC